VIHPGVQIKSVKGDALLADGNFSQIGPDFSIEAVSIHAHVKGSIPQPEQARWEARL